MGVLVSPDAEFAWPRCDGCGFPAVCSTAGLERVAFWCPRCCPHTRGWPYATYPHGDATPLDSHLAAEGVSV